MKRSHSNSHVPSLPHVGWKQEKKGLVFSVSRQHPVQLWVKPTSLSSAFTAFCPWGGVSGSQFLLLFIALWRQQSAWLAWAALLVRKQTPFGGWGRSKSHWRKNLDLSPSRKVKRPMWNLLLEPEKIKNHKKCIKTFKYSKQKKSEIYK